MKSMKKILVATMGALLLVGLSARAGIIIPDGNPIGINVPISVSTAASFVSGVSLTIDISGGNNGDLYGYLSYDGQIVTLLNRPGVTGSNPLGFTGSGFDVTLSDNGGFNINTAPETPGVPFGGGGNYSAADGSGAFATAFNGLDPNGTWTLFLADESSGGGTSTLVSWDLEVSAVPEPTNVALGIFGVCAVAGKAAGWMEKVSSLLEFNRRPQMKLLSITVNARNRPQPSGVFSMKTAAVLLLSLGLAFSGFASDVPSVNELTETLSRSPWAELPVRVVGLVRHAKAHDRKEMTIAAVKAALGLNPAAATAVVGAIARAVPAMAAVAAETAAAEQPKQAAEIALAAAAADHAAVAAIVVGVCRGGPRSIRKRRRRRVRGGARLGQRDFAGSGDGRAGFEGPDRSGCGPV